MKKNAYLVFYLILTIATRYYAQGNVYLIIGSDTAIWEGMDVSKYICRYSYTIIPDNTKNFYKVMQPSYRNKFSDSYGGKLKLTWWLMSGNIFRYADNKNVPYPNVMVSNISRAYYGDLFNQYKDELSLHYHTFVWSDYDADGKFWWNQAKNFTESKDDFYYTLAQFLIEEKIFPVSFRSGWNYMDNEWQAELDKLLPYSMHNEAPAYRTDNSEPIDNNFDWREGTTNYIPYRPSPKNYQVSGNGRGWNLHSRNVSGITQANMNDIFIKAKSSDQVVCLWGHVWDDNYPESVLKIDSLAKKAASLNPSVKFKYCSAIEGMQLWRKNSDSMPPLISLDEISYGEKIKFIVKSNEPVFQEKPFLAVKYISEKYEAVDFIKSGKSEWTSINSYDRKNIAKAAAAVTDTMGNLSTKFIDYLQDDIYIDNGSKNYSELRGNWITDNNASWGLDSRKSVIQVNDSSKARWNFNIEKPHYYGIYLQIPKIDLQCRNVLFRIYANNVLVDTIRFNESIPATEWVHLSTLYLTNSQNNCVEMIVKGSDQQAKIISADVIKVTPLVRQKWLYIDKKYVELGFVIKRDTVKTSLTVSNNGIEDLTITGISSKNNLLFTNRNLPIVIPKFAKIDLPVYFKSDDLGKKTDTLIFRSDDSFNPVLAVPFNAEVTNYFKIVDNEELANYQESGVWGKSVAQAYGSTSRFANLNQSPRAYAVFTVNVKENGYYNISFIVPKTENASNKALFIVQQGSRLLDSIYTDQNLNSGNWVTVKNHYFTNDQSINIKFIDNGKSTIGSVLRADAIKLDYTGMTSIREDAEELPVESRLFQNYPNPFNPITTIEYSIPVETLGPTSQQLVTLKVYDLLGREVRELVNEAKAPGEYSVEFRVQSVEYASGLYFYQLKAGSFIETKKMMLLK